MEALSSTDSQFKKKQQHPSTHALQTWLSNATDVFSRQGRNKVMVMLGHTQTTQHGIHCTAPQSELSCCSPKDHLCTCWPPWDYWGQGLWLDDTEVELFRRACSFMHCVEKKISGISQVSQCGSALHIVPELYQSKVLQGDQHCIC